MVWLFDNDHDGPDNNLGILDDGLFGADNGLMVWLNKSIHHF